MSLTSGIVTCRSEGTPCLKIKGYGFFLYEEDYDNIYREGWDCMWRWDEEVKEFLLPIEFMVEESTV